LTQFLRRIARKRRSGFDVVELALFAGWLLGFLSPRNSSTGFGAIFARSLGEGKISQRRKGGSKELELWVLKIIFTKGVHKEELRSF
jgi:hypothetical protein